ncbi:MAG: hypothetical protein H6Q18_235 [Bacteroidetes bacterium]|nr:hypothetical protein [Bacteroidota bacterium]
MARTVADYQKIMTDEFMNSPVMALKYGFAVGDSFDNTFSKVAVERIWLYIVAFGLFMSEKFNLSHKNETDEIIKNQRPGTLIWYKNKAMEYMHGYELVADMDYYDTTNLTDSQISEAKVVKNASAVENANVVYVKVATAEPAKLSDDQKAGLEAYFKEIKYAGVKLQIINRDADHYRAVIDIYYDPMVLNSEGISAVTGTETVRDAVSDFIAALEFNGQFRHDALRNSLNALDGVVMSELKVSQISTDNGENYDDIDAYITPDAGYMKIYDAADLTINYLVYETVSD